MKQQAKLKLAVLGIGVVVLSIAPASGAAFLTGYALTHAYIVFSKHRARVKQ